MKTKALSVLEFEKYCNNFGFNKYIYNTIDQEDRINNLDALGIYNSLIVSYNPNTVLLCEGRNYLCFKNVKSIILHSENKGAGRIFDIICSNVTENKDDRFTILGLRK